MVVAAAASMIALGVWQLDRAEQKETLLARYALAGNQPAIAFPQTDAETDQSLYRRSTVTCDSVTERNAVAGNSATGRKGLAITAICQLDGGGSANIVLGWNQAPELSDWAGGKVSGIIAPGPRLVADPPLAGLEANAKPDPADLPNNHLAYAGQWFFFAATALLIFWMAVRLRRNDESPNESPNESRD